MKQKTSAKFESKYKNWKSVSFDNVPAVKKVVSKFNRNIFSDIRVYAKRYRQCSLHDVKCLRDNRRK